MYFCVNNCTSSSNDYTAVECCNNNQAVTHSRICSLLISRRLTRPGVLRDIQFGRLRAGSGRGTHKIFDALRAPVAEPPFLNPPLTTESISSNTELDLPEETRAGCGFRFAV